MSIDLGGITADRDEPFSHAELRQQLDDLKPWLHYFKLHSGLATPTPESLRIRQTQRHNHIFPVLATQYGESLSGKTVLDLGANAGFWSFACEEWGAKVTSIEPRQHNLRQARLIAQALGSSTVEFVEGRAEDFETLVAAEHDITLVLGLLYHVSDPYALMLKVAGKTKDLVVVDSQCINDNSAYWKLCTEDTADPTQGVSEIIALPSRGALYWLLRMAGFRHIAELENWGDLPADYLKGNRVTFFARKEQPIHTTGVDSSHLRMFAESKLENRYSPLPRRTLDNSPDTVKQVKRIVTRLLRGFNQRRNLWVF